VTSRAPARPAAGRLSFSSRDLGRFVAGAGIVLFLLLMLQVVARTAAGSDSPVASGTVVLGLGLAVAVAFGIARDSSVGVIVWLAIAAFTAPYAASIPPVDRLAFLALLAGWFISVVTHRRPLRRFGLTELLMLVFVLFQVGSMVAEHVYPASTEYTPTLLLLRGALFPFTLFVLARQTMTDRRAVKSFLWALTWYGIYLTLMAIFQKIGPQALVFPREIVDPSLGINPERARGPLLNSAADGVALVMAFVAALFLASRRDLAHRRFALVAALVMPIGIFYTNTRAIWLAAGVAVVLGIMFAAGYRRWYLVILGGAAAVIAINWQRFLSADRLQGGVTSEEEINGRLNDIATSLWALHDKPIFGWGISRYPEVNTYHHQAWGNIDWKLNYNYLSHNTYLAIGAEGGYVGMGLWFAILGAVLVVAFRAYRRLPREGLLSKGLVLAFICAFLAYVINAAVIDMRLFTLISAIIFVWAGIVAGVGDRAGDGTLDVEPAPEPEPEPVEEPQPLIGLTDGLAPPPPGPFDRRRLPEWR